MSLSVTAGPSLRTCREVYLCAWVNKSLLAQAVPAEAQLPRWRSPSPVVSFSVTIDGAAPTMERGRDRTGCPPTHTSPQIVAPRDAEALAGMTVVTYARLLRHTCHNCATAVFAPLEAQGRGVMHPHAICASQPAVTTPVPLEFSAGPTYPSP